MSVVPGHAGEHWMILLPDEVRDGREHCPNVLTVIRETDRDTPYWAMDTLELYRAYCEFAAEHRFLLEFIVTKGAERIDLAILIMREIAHRYNISYDQLYIDVSRFCARGRSINEIPAFELRDSEGHVIKTPEDAVESLAPGIEAIKFGRQWITRESLEFANFTPGRIGELPFDFERLIRSQVGQKMADAMRLEYDYVSGEDDGLQNHLRAMGLRYVYRRTKERGWFAIVPESAFAEPEPELPCMLILQEIVEADPHSIPSALSMWYEYLRIASQGDLMLLFFVLEDADSNDLLCDILKGAEEEFPFLDPERVFITGHSHNGYFSLEFAYRHPELLAGVATLGNGHGLCTDHNEPPVTRDHLERFHSVDMPLINIDGQWENMYATPGLQMPNVAPLTEEQRVRYWRNRLYAWHCPPCAKEAVLSAPESGSLVTRKLGVPVDRERVVYYEGDECYVGDVRNEDGKSLLRLVTIENLPHALSAHMPWLTWSFLRRFRRDAKTGNIVEIYKEA